MSLVPLRHLLCESSSMIATFCRVPLCTVSVSNRRRMATDSQKVTLDPSFFHSAVTNIGVGFFCGVPDSLLKDYCAYVTKNTRREDHIITVNEGNAVALASGYHLSTSKIAMVYLQNSGLGNTVNPLMSLASNQVCSIPLLLLIGWRGEPGLKDEPQHQTQGKITPAMLDVMGIPYEELPRKKEAALETLQRAKKHMEENKSPFGLLVRTSTFSSYKLPPPENPGFTLKREEAMQTVVEQLGDTDIIVSSTGMLSRELYEYRVLNKMTHERDFLTVGAMGHTSSIGLAISLQKPERKVFTLDGDGAALMHMGAFATIGQHALSNFRHILFNNGAHDSVGGQPTEAAHHDTFSFGKIALACGYKQVWRATTKEEIKTCIAEQMATPGPSFLEVKIALGARGDLGRPTRTPIQNKVDFMKFVQQH